MHILDIIINVKKIEECYSAIKELQKKIIAKSEGWGSGRDRNDPCLAMLHVVNDFGQIQLEQR